MSLTMGKSIRQIWVKTKQTTDNIFCRPLLKILCQSNVSTYHKDITYIKLWRRQIAYQTKEQT